MKPTILIVDDEAGVRTALSGVLRDEGYAVDTVDSGEAFRSPPMVSVVVPTTA